MGKQWKQWNFLLLGSKITADGDCSHEFKRCFLLWRKAMTNLESIIKSRDITLPTKVSLAKAMVFPVVMYRHKSWTINKAEHWRIDAFELWCWRRLLRVSWAARRSNQSTLKESSPEYVRIQGSLMCCSPWNCRVGQDWVTEWQQWWFKNRGMVSWYRLESVSLGANVTL